MNRIIRGSISILIATACFAPAHAAEQSVYKEVIELLDKDRKAPARRDLSLPSLPVDVKMSFGGYMKANAIFSYYSDGDVSTPSSGRDYFRPLSIPVATPRSSEESSSHFDGHAKDSRFWFLSKGTIGNHTIGSRLELDFRLSEQGNEIVSNSYSPRLRRAFISFDNWVLGQEWTLLRNHAANPESLDSLGVTDGQNFGRQPQIRYTIGQFQASLESNETFILRNGGAGRVATGDGVIPDLHLRWNFKPSFGSFSVSTVVRQLRARRFASGAAAPNDEINDTTFGLGISAGGMFKLPGKDNIRVLATLGKGIGSYQAIATSADAVITDDGELETIGAFNGLLSWQHWWSARWRSTIAVSGLFIDNDLNQTGEALTKSVRSARVNLIFQPFKQFFVGAELLQATRELENGQDGSHTRPQITFKYSY